MLVLKTVKPFALSFSFTSRPRVTDIATLYKYFLLKFQYINLKNCQTLRKEPVISFPKRVASAARITTFSVQFYI